MTDPRNAQPGSYWTSGHGAEAGDESRVAANSGRASVRPNRPGAASPAGWFPPPAGEAAPPVRLREPARSDGASPYDVETRPTSMYRVPWQSARADRTPARGAETAAPGGPSAPDRARTTPLPRGLPRTSGRARPTCAGRRSPGGDHCTFPWSARPRRCAAGPAAPGWTCRPARSPACSTTSGSPAGSSPSAYGRTPGSAGRNRRRRSRTTRRPVPVSPRQPASPRRTTITRTMTWSRPVSTRQTTTIRTMTSARTTSSRPPRPSRAGT